jgi:hypothetical protein
MPLHESCKSYVGRKVFVLPYYGYGWGREDVGAPPPDTLSGLGPLPFLLRVSEFIACGREVVGASGAIEEAQHPLDKQWCCFYLRLTSEHDFTNRPGQYMIWIAERKLSIDARPERARYEWVSFDKSFPCLCGYGAVAESVEWIRNLYDTTMATRRLRGGGA